VGNDLGFLMTETSETNGQAPAAPVVVEQGRYKMFEAPGGLVLARAVNTCDRCQGCGCGDQAEPLELPDPRKGRMHLIGWLTTNANKGIMGALGKAMSAGE
jgi:hypothetical protein